MSDEKCIMDPQRDCLGLIKARELEQDMNELRRQNSASHERIFDRLAALETHDAVQVTQFEMILEKLDGLAKKVGELEAKPGKRWEAIVGQVIGLVVAALVGAAIARLGL